MYKRASLSQNRNPVRSAGTVFAVCDCWGLGMTVVLLGGLILLTLAVVVLAVHFLG